MIHPQRSFCNLTLHHGKRVDEVLRRHTGCLRKHEGRRIKNVHFLDITQNGTGAWWRLGAAGGGCDGHRFLAHALMGKIAAPKVKEAMRWKTDDTLGSWRAGN